MKSLRARLLLFILAPTLLFFIGMSIYVSTTFHQVAVTDAEEMLQAHGESLAHELRLDLESALTSAHTLSNAFAGVIKHGHTPRRENVNVMLQQMLDTNPNAVSAWMYWEENAFDGKDKEYAGTTGHDGTGRYIPVWSRGDNGYVVEPLEGYDEPGELHDNINYVLSTGKAHIFEPYSYDIGGEELLMTSVAAPVTIDGETVGMTGMDISLANINQRVDQFSFYDTGFAGLMSNTGLVLAHQNKDLIGTNYFESDAMKGRSDVEQVRSAVQIGEAVRIEGFSNALQTDVYRLFTPISISGVETPWSAFLAVPINEVTQEARTMTLIIVTVSIVVTAALIVIIIFVANGIVRPIQEAVAHGGEMAAGNFTRNVPEHYLRRKDEIGALAHIFATLNSNLSTLIGQVQESTRTVLNSSQALDEAARSSASAANEVAGAIEEVARSAESQMQSAEESARSMEEMTSGVQNVAQGSAHVMEAAHEMKERSLMGQQAVSNAVQQMERIQDETDQTRAVIERLHADAEKIGNIVSIITDISEQTNLLALNAAIEAARAGDAGRGFAVVAEEVRKLADETNQSSVEIQQLVEAIQSNSLQASESMKKNEMEVKEGIERNKEVDNTFDGILSAIEEVAQEIEQLSAVSEEMSAISEEIAASSQEIASSAETASGHTQQVAAAAEEQLASMEEMRQTAATLQGLANELDTMLQQFKVSNSK